MRVIGTAGHVDHGKSTLVRALTGIDPDRLKEEKERQMTIDLGFAWLTLPGGEPVGIIDVPGHRDFIENMLAGVGGIDAAVLVVDAEEGVMPQTREHLAILDLLEVSRAVVALTKVDLVEDPAWLELVREEVERLLAPTRLAGAPTVAVSAREGSGLDELLATLEAELDMVASRPVGNRPRLGIDRAFSISGFGTVVTGTLIDGELRVGDQVEILPQALPARVRGLQTHQEAVERAVAGSRAAVNLSGVDVARIERGDVLVKPGTYEPSTLIDVGFRLLPDSPSSLRHNQEVKLFLGAAQAMARVRVLGSGRLLPGERGWLQLVLERPVIAASGDHYILRRPSPSATLGGGIVIDPHPARLHRLKDPDVPHRLERLSAGTPEQVVEQILAGGEAIRDADLVQRSGLERGAAEAAIESQIKEGRIVAVGPGAPGAGERLLLQRGLWDRLVQDAVRLIEAYHETHPLSVGMPREELKSRLALDTAIFGGLLSLWSEQGHLEAAGPVVKLPGFEPTLTAEQSSAVSDLLGRFSKDPYSPPSFKDALDTVGPDVLAFLLESGRLVQVSPEVLFGREAYEKLVQGIIPAFEQAGELTVAEVRDHFGTSRKYALALLEHLDAAGVTVREGDVRRLRKASE